MSDVVSKLTAHGHSACHGGSYGLNLTFPENGNMLVRQCNVNLTCGILSLSLYEPFHYTVGQLGNR